MSAAAAHSNELHTGLWRSVQPEGALEVAAFNDLLRARRNIERLQRLEIAPVQNEANAHARWQRTFHRALSELRRLQTDATLRVKLDAESDERLTPLASGTAAILQPAELRRLACQAAVRENRIDFVTSLEDCSFDRSPNEAKRFVNRGLSRRPAS